MSMNTINSLRMVLIYAVEFLDIIPNTSETDADIAAISQMIAAYDALAPDWSQAPDGAEWYTIDTNGCAWHDDVEPSPFESCWESDTAAWGGIVLIPLGLDWRLLKWQRPEVAA